MPVENCSFKRSPSKVLKRIYGIEKPRSYFRNGYKRLNNYSRNLAKNLKNKSLREITSFRKEPEKEPEYTHTDLHPNIQLNFINDPKFQNFNSENIPKRVKERSLSKRCSIRSSLFNELDKDKVSKMIQRTLRVKNIF